MKTRISVVAAGLAALVSLSFVGASYATSSTAAKAPAEVALPAAIDDFRLSDQNLHSHELYQLGDASAVVLITQQNSCPVSRNNATAVQALVDAYKPKGVEIFMLNSTPSDKREDIVVEAAAYGYNLPILLDSNQLVGEQLGVTRTAEVIVLDPKSWKIVYRGPIDDRVTYERQKASADHTWAKDALDAQLAGKPVAVAQVQPVGCLIDFPERAKLATSKVTYVKNIAPMFEDKCVSCHQQGGIGPMSLTSYDQIKPFSPMIREMIRTQRMPPWRADPTVGHFLGDRSLSSAQIKMLVHWVEAGAPRGTGADPLAAKNFKAPEWPLGKPDLVLDIPSYTIPANGVVEYQRPWVVSPLTEGKWLRATTIKVENRQVVHHVLTGYLAEVPAKGAPANESKWGASLGGYAVGAESIVQPADTGVYIPPGGAVGFQVHYTPFGQEVTEHSQIALYFYKDKPKYVMHTSVVANPNIEIPPNQESVQRQAYITVPKDALLFAVFPHAHYRGSSSQFYMIAPDGQKTLLISLPHYDFNWQRNYYFAEPVKVAAGSKLLAIYTYDNSVRNPANPDHNRTVPWGDQSFDEMLYTAFQFEWVGETSDKMDQYVAYDKELNANRVFGMLDTKVNGKLDASELTGPIGKQFAASFAKIDTDHDGFIEPNELLAAQANMQKRRQQQAQQQEEQQGQGAAAPAAAGQAPAEKTGGGQ
ncbi:MAG: redoxin domain-containing protein [Steroidobacteraceae bacterium]